MRQFSASQFSARKPPIGVIVMRPFGLIVEIMPPSVSTCAISTSGLPSPPRQQKNAALSCFFRSVAECCQFTDKIVRSFIRKAGRRIDGKQGFKLGKAIVHIHVLPLLTKK